MGHRPGAGGGDRVAQRRPGHAAWLAVVALGAVPVAWAAAALGAGIVASDWPLRDVAGLVLWSVSEEVVFRGGIQTALARVPAIAKRHLAGPGGSAGTVTLANALTSVLFATAHLWHKSALVAAAVFPVSLVLGASLERTGLLRVPAALHTWFNLLLYAASAWHAA
ncbi:MAG: CPBP family intramembrane metalloprotease [Rubrivivax sp.]|nr:CPBP family intramembrane metalloprotease [Rubrivivax sp.]